MFKSAAHTHLAIFFRLTAAIACGKRNERAAALVSAYLTVFSSAADL
jgi:hypothetical protein